MRVVRFISYNNINSHAGLSLRLEMDGHLQKLLRGRECVKHDYLALAKTLEDLMGERGMEKEL